MFVAVFTLHSFVAVAVVEILLTFIVNLFVGSVVFVIILIVFVVEYSKIEN